VGASPRKTIVVEQGKPRSGDSCIDLTGILGVAGEVVSRSVWERLPNAKKFLAIVDKCTNTEGLRGKPITYYRKMIAAGGPREHFCWFHHRSGTRGVDCVIESRVHDHRFDECEHVLNDAGLEAKEHRLIPTKFSRTIDINVNADQVNQDNIWTCIARVLEMSAEE
jgi:hypothetical protein